MNSAHFIDLNIIIDIKAKPWIVSKENPNIPILKIEPHNFNLFKSGIYRGHNNKMDFNGKDFWISNDFMNEIKRACKKYKCDISRLYISMQEYLNPDVSQHIDFTIDLKIFNSIINTNDDIYIICSKNTKSNYTKQIEKLEEKLKEIGLSVKNYYYISETFYNRDEDDISFYKIKLLIQHLIGLKTDNNKITGENITEYNHIHFYDDCKKSIELCKNINSVLENLTSTTSNEIKSIIKSRVKNSDCILTIKEYTHNKAKSFIETIIPIEYSNVIRKFENFSYIKENIEEKVISDEDFKYIKNTLADEMMEIDIYEFSSGDNINTYRIGRLKNGRGSNYISCEIISNYEKTDNTKKQTEIFKNIIKNEYNVIIYHTSMYRDKEHLTKSNIIISSLK